MERHDRPWLLGHLHEQARYLVALTTYARSHREDVDLLVRIRDEVFTLRETLDTLGVPHALVDNATWGQVPYISHRPEWPSASDL
jgi:hypothetical protein